MPEQNALVEAAKRPGVRRRNGLKKVDLPPTVRALHAAATPALREATDLAQNWLFARVGEVYQTHGLAGAGVCAMLQQAAQAYAWSWYLDALAREADGTGDGERMLELSQRASQQGQFARQQELAAYEIAAREGKAARASDKPGKSALLAAQGKG